MRRTLSAPTAVRGHFVSSYHFDFNETRLVGRLSLDSGQRESRVSCDRVGVREGLMTIHKNEKSALVAPLSFCLNGEALPSMMCFCQALLLKTEPSVFGLGLRVDNPSIDPETV